MTELFKKFVAIALSVSLLGAVNAHATGVNTIIGDDGKVYTESRPGTQRLNIDCNGLSVRLQAEQFSGQNVTLMAVVSVEVGESRQALRLMTELSDLISEEHTLQGMKFGCLSGDGGAGIILKSISAQTEPAFIQIDRHGRVFKRFNETGYMLEDCGSSSE